MADPINLSQSYHTNFKPHYSAKETQATEGVNLALLCIRLNEAFSQYDLLALCVELRLMPGRFGLDRPYLKLEGLIALIDHCDKNGRLPQLLEACQKIHPGITDELAIQID